MFQNKIGLLVCGLCFLVQAHAGEVATVGDLAQIQADTVLLKAKIKKEDAQNELNQKAQSSTGFDGVLPVLKSIIATNNKGMVASFIFPGSVVMSASEGETLPGGYRVDKIYAETDKVALSRGKDKFTVGFSTIAPMSKSSGQSMPGMPGYMPVPPIR